MIIDAFCWVYLVSTNGLRDERTRVKIGLIEAIKEFRMKWMSLKSTAYLPWILAGGALGAGVFFQSSRPSVKQMSSVQPVTEGPVQKSHALRPSVNVAQKVTEHLQKVDSKRAVDRLRVKTDQMQLKGASKRAIDQGRVRLESDLGTMNLAESSIERRLRDDLDRGTNNHLQPDQNATERINRMLAMKQYEQNLGEATNEAFIEQFRRNAEASGYEVIIEDFEVVGVRPLRSKSPSRIHSSSSF